MSRSRRTAAVVMSVAAVGLVTVVALLAGSTGADARAVVPSPQASAGALVGGNSDVALVRAHAGEFMKAAGTVHAVRGDGTAVRDMLFRPNEGPADVGLFAPGRQLLVSRVDGEAGIDLTAVPMRPGIRLAPQQAVITVTDPGTGNLVSVTTVALGDTAQSDRYDLARFGTPTAVDVEASDLLSARVAAVDPPK